jgi:hypothetical protein
MNPADTDTCNDEEAPPNTETGLKDKEVENIKFAKGIATSEEGLGRKVPSKR